MKKLSSLVIAFAMLLSLAACGGNSVPQASPTPLPPPTPAAAAGPFTPGSYETTGQGNNGPVTVKTTMDASGILSVEVLSHSETPSIGDAAVEALPGRIVETQSLDVDTVSGATNTSNAILEAVEAALTAAGGARGDLTARAVSGEAEALADAETQLVIVGAGGAGMAAAIEAANQGVEVILVEKLSMVGGTTALASTAYNAGGTSVQMALDKPYTADDYYKKLLGSAKEDDPTLRQLADLSGADGDWLISMGADLSKVINGSQHTPGDGSALGAMLVPVLKGQLDKLSIDYRTDTEATEILMDGGKAVGVRVETADGAYDIHAQAVVLTTGGFASNPEMVAQYTPQWAGYPSTASVGATGDGIRMAQAAGAALAGMEKAGPQTVAFDTGHGAVSLTNVRYNGAILVNAEGRRFVDELSDTSTLGAAIKEQTGGYAYLVFDQVSVDNAALMAAYKEKGYFTESDTLEGLAAALGVDAAALADTVAAYQSGYDAGEDKEFGRTESLFSRIDTPSYYGAKISPASQTTYGGVKVDLGCRALTEDGTAIPGLYAGGETACQSGQGVTIAIVLGRLAAQTAIADLG